MPQSAPPANPAPVSVMSSSVAAGTILHLGAPCMSTNCTSKYAILSASSCFLSAMRSTGFLRQGMGCGVECVYNPRNKRKQAGNAMCGIVGFLDKRGGADHPVGRTLLNMLQALSCRGPDSAGIAAFGTQGDWHVRLSARATS